MLLSQARGTVGKFYPRKFYKRKEISFLAKKVQQKSCEQTIFSLLSGILVVQFSLPQR